MKKHVKVALALLILAITIVAFIRYAAANPSLLATLKDTSPVLVVALILCYIVWFLALVWCLRISLRLYGKTISKQENILLNAYSSLVNFFGPGQSGPAFRGLYLKKRHGLPIKNYIFATLIYYGFYALISAFLLCVGSRPWWQTALLTAGVGAISFIVIRRYARRTPKEQKAGLSVTNLALLFAATALQLAVQTAIYYLELREAQGTISFSQALTYTGLANFALFVSVTPGAIGIREALLVLGQQLHGLSNGVVVAANVIDRAVYLFFLGLLFVMVLALHAKDKLHIKQVTDRSS